MEKEKIPEVESIKKEEEEVIDLEKNEEEKTLVKETLEFLYEVLAADKVELEKTDDENIRQKIQAKIDDIEMQIGGFKQVLGEE